MADDAPLRPFRFSTRRRFQPVETKAWAANTALNFKLPEVGYVNRIYIVVQGTMNFNGGNALAEFGPWAIINRIECKLNRGNVVLTDVSGYGAYLISAYLERGSLLNKSGQGDTTPGAYYSAPVTDGNKAWTLVYCIPIAANDGPDFDLGCINLQAPEIQFDVNVRCGAVSDAASIGTGTGFTGTVKLFYDYDEVPDLGTVQQPPFVLHRWLEEIESITKTGDYIYTCPRMGILMQMLHVVRLNAAKSNGVDTFQLKINKTDSVYYHDLVTKLAEQRMQTGLELPTGVFAWDFWHSMGHVSQGDFRDAIDTEGITTLESILNVSGSLGSNNNDCRTIRRIIQTVDG